jgi:hypothetical protein
MRASIDLAAGLILGQHLHGRAGSRRNLGLR